MAKHVTRLNVLIASPGDVDAEREAAVQIVDEVNRLLERQCIELRPRTWESDAVTQIGDRPQAILNDQFGDSCDIFVGIMWSRAGTPTGAEISGTIEEFRRAKLRFDADPRSVRILFFFCNRHVDPLKLDIDQFAKARSFREEVEKLGLISTYSSTEEFELKLRQALQKHALDWGQRWGPVEDYGDSKNELVGNAPVALAKAEPPVEEIGFLDAMEEATQDSQIAADAMSRVSEATDDLTEEMNRRIEDMDKLGTHRPVDPKKAKSIANLAAGNLETYNTRIGADFPIFQRAFSKSLERMSDVVLLTNDFAMNDERRAELESTRKVLSELKEQVQRGVQAMIGMRNSIAGVPRMTTRFNAARRQALRILGEFIDSEQPLLDLIDTVHDQISEALNRPLD